MESEHSLDQPEEDEDVDDEVLDEGHEIPAIFSDLVFRSSVTCFHRKITVT